MCSIDSQQREWQLQGLLSPNIGLRMEWLGRYPWPPADEQIELDRLLSELHGQPGIMRALFD